MGMHMVIALAAAIAVTAAAPAAPPPPGNGACDRACLEGVLDQYLKALPTHDPSRAPLAREVIFTENGQRLSLPDGLWNTADGLRPYRLAFVDPPAGEVGAFAVVGESGETAILAIRLKVLNRRITEVETQVARPGGALYAADQLTEPKPIWARPLKRSERSSTADMIRIADSYFEGLEQETDKLTPWDKDCVRVENGVQVTSNPARNTERSKLGGMTCQQQFATGFSKFITQVRERRYLVVDEERGLVYAVVFFDHAGNVPQVKLADGSVMQVAPAYRKPRTWMIAELFKIRSGRIAQIQAVLVDVPYHMESGWTDHRR